MHVAHCRQLVVASRKLSSSKGQPTLYQKFVLGILPYRIGGRKLMNNLKVTHNLLWKEMINLKHEITPRERRLIVRTVFDLLRFVPFAFLAALPGGSVGVLFLAKYIPSSLPSTFQVPSPEVLQKLSYEAEADFQLDMDKDLKYAIQNMVEHMHQNQIKEYREIQNLISHAGKGLSSDDPNFILSYSKLNDQDLLDLLNSKQLIKLAEYFHFESKYFVIDTYQYAILRYRLSNHLSQVYSDDAVLFQDRDSHTLSSEELYRACFDRGLVCNNENIPDTQLSRRLNLWLLNTQGRNVPPVLQAFSNFQHRFKKTLSAEKHDN